MPFSYVEDISEGSTQNLQILFTQCFSSAAKLPFFSVIANKLYFIVCVSCKSGNFTKALFGCHLKRCVRVADLWLPLLSGEKYGIHSFSGLKTFSWQTAVTSSADLMFTACGFGKIHTPQTHVPELLSKASLWNIPNYRSHRPRDICRFN